jgi:hypothetical protein
MSGGTFMSLKDFIIQLLKIKECKLKYDMMDDQPFMKLIAKEYFNYVKSLYSVHSAGSPTTFNTRPFSSLRLNTKYETKQTYNRNEVITYYECLIRGKRSPPAVSNETIYYIRNLF